jgi:hypothetical protein
MSCQPTHDFAIVSPVASQDFGAKAERQYTGSYR